MSQGIGNGTAPREAASPPATGIVAVSRGRLALTAPPDRPSCGSLRYALGFPFQAGPRQFGLIAMRTIEETANYGFLDGSDILLLDELRPPSPEQVFAATRSEIEPGAAGEPSRLLLKSPLMGGFVPRGARLPDGGPHPYAGTGFGIGQAQRFPFREGRFSWGDPGRQDLLEVYQLAYDGRAFTTRQSGVWPQNADTPLPIGDTGWSILVTGLSNAIPDGVDLLLPVLAARTDRTAVGVGVVRWTGRDGAWRPVGYDPVVTTVGRVPAGPNPMERCPWMEPSLARAADGGLLFCARGADSFGQEGDTGQGYRMSVWRAVVGGVWQQVVDEPLTRLNSPVTVGVTTDGSAYVVSNPYDPAFVPETDATGRGREKLVLWPLTTSGGGLAPALPIRDCLAELGLPPAGRPEQWMADHANGVTVRLRDGCWHHLLAYRVCHYPRYRPSATAPSPHSGCYLEEIVSRGEARPVWQFAEEE